MAGVKGRSGRKPNGEEEELRALLKRGWPKADRLATFVKLAEEAKAGDKEAVKILMAYAYGKPKERKELTGDEGGPLRVIVEYGGGGTDAQD